MIYIGAILHIIHDPDHSAERSLKRVQDMNRLKRHR